MLTDLKKKKEVKVFFFFFFFFFLLLVSTWMIATAAAGNAEVTYDGRALIINGTRRLLFSGSIHYPRSTPQMWPSLIAKAKEGGLDVIQTYVFWNVHEPVQGQYNFSGRFDLVRFIKEVQSQGLYVSLRIGPFTQAEWSYGGLPLWLHDVPGIVFRSDNEPFKFHMQKFVTKIVDLMKSKRLFASQGGPIVISQIENEYKLVEAAFHEKGPPYVEWAASMAVGLQTGVPWMMCKQDDAPDPVINACNGLNCGLTFEGPNSPQKPAIWTENWTFVYQVYGKDPSSRSAQDIAFAVALFIAKKNGSFVNYYMYHGGTNFGKSAASYVTTAYYDRAPIDEYGLIWLPTWGHLRDLHAVIKQSEEALLWGVYSNSSFGQQQEAHVFQTNSGQCVAFLVNYDEHDTTTLQFRGAMYTLSARSISVLPNCKDVAFDTSKVSAQTGERSATPIQYLSQDQQWQAFADEVINQNKSSFAVEGLEEQMSLIKDTTDYLWYTISYNHSQLDGPQTLHVGSRAHVLHVFINGKFVGSVHGDHDGALPNFEQPIELSEGSNDISLLSVMVGLPDSGAYLERRVAGLRRVRMQGSSGSQRDLTNWLWHYKVGLTGESMLIFSEQGSGTAEWKSLQDHTNKPLMWYKTRFDAPEGDDPVVLNLENMGKGEVWINGESIGRYWASFRAPSGDPTQSLYHIPRSFLKPSSNLLVLFEELGGDPRSIGVETMSVSRVCSRVSELHYPSVLSKSKDPYALLQCPRGRNISMIEFGSYGTPIGECLAYPNKGNCHAPESEAIIQKACLGKQECTIFVTNEMFGGDPCVGTPKSLLVFGRCS